jgi:hypothetical protein
MTYGFQTAYDSLFHLKTSHTSAQSGSSSVGGSVTVTGSEATYTPSSSASKVVYEINFFGQRTDDIHNVSFMLYHYVSGAWAQINDQNARSSIVSGASSQSNRDSYHLRYVIPTWTGARQLRLVLGTRVADEHIILHQLTEWDGSTVSDQFGDTTLIVYSV